MFVSSAYSRTLFQIMLRHDIHLYCDGELFYDIVYGKSFDPLPAHFDCRIQPSVQLESAIAGLARDHCPRPRSSSTVHSQIRRWRFFIMQSPRIGLVLDCAADCRLHIALYGSHWGVCACRWGWSQNHASHLYIHVAPNLVLVAERFKCVGFSATDSWTLNPNHKTLTLKIAASDWVAEFERRRSHRWGNGRQI